MSILFLTKQRERNIDFNAERPFPSRRCRHCGKLSVVIRTIEYTLETRHEGRLFPLTIPKLQIPVCGECGKKSSRKKLTDGIHDALHIALLTPP